MKLHAALDRVRGKGELSRARTRAVFSGILAGGFDAALLADLLRGSPRGARRPPKIAGGADALREAMVPFEHGFEDAIDTCGTGGDGSDPSTSRRPPRSSRRRPGARVVKHGNREPVEPLRERGPPRGGRDPARSSRADRSRAVLEGAGITFLFAPAHHPALRHAAP
jgi:anthranilate phosphoribosyltransferase